MDNSYPAPVKSMLYATPRIGETFLRDTARALEACGYANIEIPQLTNKLGHDPEKNGLAYDIAKAAQHMPQTSSVIPLPLDPREIPNEKRKREVEPASILEYLASKLATAIHLKDDLSPEMRTARIQRASTNIAAMERADSQIELEASKRKGRLL